jgi:hypothetical protein
MREMLWLMPLYWLNSFPKVTQLVRNRGNILTWQSGSRIIILNLDCIWDSWEEFSKNIDASLLDDWRMAWW